MHSGIVPSANSRHSDIADPTGYSTTPEVVVPLDDDPIQVCLDAVAAGLQPRPHLLHISHERIELRAQSVG